MVSEGDGSWVINRPLTMAFLLKLNEPVAFGPSGHNVSDEFDTGDFAILGKDRVQLLFIDERGNSCDYECLIEPVL